MAEHAARRERLIAAAPIGLEGLCILPIHRLVLQGSQARAGAWLAASMEPLAVLVRDAGGIRLMAIDPAAPLSLTALREHLPGLDAALSLPTPAAP